MAVAVVDQKPSVRSRDAERKRRERESERSLERVEVGNPARRRAALADPVVFLQTYFPERFDQPFTPDRLAMIQAILQALQTKLAQALAAPRESGKTSITVGLTCYCVLTGGIKFALLLAATETHAQERLLENIKYEFEQNQLLCEDFPEVCTPIRDASEAVNRAKSQRYDGERTRIEWTREALQFPQVMDALNPKVPSPAAGVIVRCRGITSSLRGMNYQGRRPDLVIIDDPDDEESADSPVKTAKLVAKINKSIRGLGRAGKGLARVMLCTVINRQCAAFQYTDAKQYPAWNGRRHKAVDVWPDRMDMWEKYIELLKEGQENGDRFGRIAHRFYLDNRAAMDAGAVVVNPYQFEASELPDGTEKEASSLQHVFNIIADVGMDTFCTEYQNDPPNDEIEKEARLSPFKVRGSHPEYSGRLTSDARGFVPDGCQCLTAAVDVQKRSLYFEIVAWMPGRRAHIVDYGNFGDASIADRMGQSESVKANLNELLDIWRLNPCCGNDGAVPFNMVLVDSGYETAVVHEFTERVGRPWRSSMGDPRYHQPKGPGPDKKPSRSGDRWYESKVGRVWQVNFDPDWWKHRCHDAFTVAPKELPPNCVTLFGRNGDSVIEPKYHAAFGEMVCAEEWQEEFKEGKGIKAEWVRIRKDNHYLDTHVLNMVAASMCGLAVARQKSMPSRRYGVLSKGV